jgi:hypothetical protein
MPVRVRGVADGTEQLEPLAHAEPAPVTVRVDRLALDVLHHEVGPAVRRCTAVQQPRDVGVVARGEDLPLVAEAAQHLVRVHAALDDLERHSLLEMLVRALGQVDHAHAAAADLVDDAVGSDARPGSERLVAAEVIRAQLGEERRRERVDGVADCRLCFGRAFEQREHLAVQLLVSGARALQGSLALGRCDVERGREHLVDLLPAFRGEAVHRHRWRSLRGPARLGACVPPRDRAGHGDWRAAIDGARGTARSAPAPSPA